jgi:hypothetical protein
VTESAPKRGRKRKPKPLQVGESCPRCGYLAHTGRATQAELEALHALVADLLLKELKARRAEGKPGSSRLVSVAASFLKANGIDKPHLIHSQIDELLQHLPDLDSLDPH